MNNRLITSGMRFSGLSNVSFAFLIVAFNCSIAVGNITKAFSLSEINLFMSVEAIVNWLLKLVVASKEEDFLDKKSAKLIKSWKEFGLIEFLLDFRIFVKIKIFGCA